MRYYRPSNTPHWPPIGYTIRHEQNADRMFYRAMRVSGPEWVSPYLRATYEVALRDANEHYTEA